MAALEIDPPGMMEREMDDSDIEALERLAPILGAPECSESWRQGFSSLVCQEARPAGDLRESFRPTDIADVVASACSRGNGGFACALFRLVDGTWATIDISTDDTLGEFMFFGSRGYVSRELSNVVLYGLGHHTRYELGIPNDVDRAIDWVRSVERDELTPRSVALGMLGNPGVWREVLDELAAEHEEHDGGPPAPFAPGEIIGVVAVGELLPTKSNPGWAAAVVRLRDSWGSLEADVASDSGEAMAYRVHLARPQVSSLLAQVAWWGISETRRQALGFPIAQDEFRAWATFVERGYPATAHRYRRLAET